MSVEGAQTHAPSEAAQSLRVVLDLLLQDISAKQVEPSTLPWDRPILVLRSAHMERMRAFLREVASHCPTPTLHVMSHPHDETAIREMAPCDFTFHAYPTPGPYRLDELPPEMLDSLRSVGFATVFSLDAGTAGNRLDAVEELLAAILENDVVSFRGDGTYARMANRRQRKLAESAFFQLMEWYHVKLDPGFPDGVVLPSAMPSPRP